MRTASRPILAQSETQLVAACLQYLTLRGALPIRINSGAVRGEHKGKKRFVRFNSAKGCSDLIVSYRGRFLAVEVKVGNNKPTEEQQRFLDRVTATDSIACVVYSVDDLAKVLDAIAKEPS